MFEPSLKPGYVVFIAGKLKKFFKIGNIEAFQYATGESESAEFAAVADGADSDFKNIKTLQPDRNPPRLFECVWGVKDGCTYALKIPTGTNRLGTDEDKDVGRIDNLMSPWINPNPMFKFWLIYNYYPAIKADNETGASLTPKVYFYGYKYDLAEEVTDAMMRQRLEKYRKGEPGGLPFTHIVLGGVSG